MTAQPSNLQRGALSRPCVCLLRIAAFLAMTAVIAGAFGAHFLKTRLAPESLATFETAARYQMYHALGMLGVCWVMSVRPSRCVTAAGVCMLIGVVLFSGSLYLLCFLPWRWLGPVTPLGGGFLIVSWLLLIFAAGTPRGEVHESERCGVA